MQSRLGMGLTVLCLLVSLPALAQGTVDQEDIEIDPSLNTPARVTDGTYTGHGAMSKVRDDVMLNDYGICASTDELSVVLFVTEDHWLLMEQSATLGAGGRIKLWVDGRRIGGHVDELCVPRAIGRTCQNVGMPGELAGTLAGGKMYGKIKGSNQSFTRLRKIKLKYQDSADDNVCD